MNPQERRSRLGAFLAFLSDEFAWDFERDEFDDRFLLQKYVFFAQRLGFDLPYRYNVYVFGAYSPSLAQDYFSEELPEDLQSDSVADSFDTQAFEELAKNRDSRWLEIASTLVLYYERFQHMDPDDRRIRAIEKTGAEKEATDNTVRQVYSNLADIGLLE